MMVFVAKTDRNREGGVFLSARPRARTSFIFGVGQKLADALISNGLVRSTSPFSEKVPVKGVTWLEPSLAAEGSYAEIMEGGSLRAGVFRGFVGG